MKKFWRAFTAFWRGPQQYRYPAQDIHVDGREFHLVGSVHMGTPGMMPLPAVLQRHLAQADALVVEADITAGSSAFDFTSACPPLAERITPHLMVQFNRQCEVLAISPDALATLPGWQIALALQTQQAQHLGLRTQYGIDLQLLHMAVTYKKRLIELEGTQAQLALLHALPDNGLSLLHDTLEQWHTNAHLLQTMVSWWQDTPPRRTTQLPTAFNHALNDLLMFQRNQRWHDILRALPAGKYVVAVGALHLYGADNLPDLLKK